MTTFVLSLDWKRCGVWIGEDCWTVLSLSQHSTTISSKRPVPSHRSRSGAALISCAAEVVDFWRSYKGSPISRSIHSANSNLQDITIYFCMMESKNGNTKLQVARRFEFETRNVDAALNSAPASCDWSQRPSGNSQLLGVAWSCLDA